jgi:hypothetical protein
MFASLLSLHRGLLLADCALLLQSAATFYMVGVIWLIQTVHYPLMAAVGAPQFVAYAQQHVARIGPVVAPAMLVEAATAVASLYLLYPLWPAMRPWLWVGLVVLLGIWASTALLQVPCHTVLQQRYEPAVLHKLVATNWLRTLGWSLRGLVMLYLLWLRFGPSLPLSKTGV